ncbi:MAG: 2'-deoxycytidine 5'-triphosphate deaminase, partial [Pseudomonadota bacterium]|nr:2'-deoxycytidine 5'-triphosphate deaminase [Pseudomonadota bacterium]
MPASAGILPSQAIRALVNSGVIAAARGMASEQIQPASLDLRLGETAFRVRASFLPGPGVRVIERLERFALHAFDLREGAVLETGCVYIVPLLESLKLDPGMSAACNPKSSTGRLDVFTRVIADGARAFDQVPHGYTGALYAEICPQTFPVLVRTGSRLSQIRFRLGDVEASDAGMKALHSEQALVSSADADIDRGVALSVDLTGDPETGLIGYRAKRHTGLVDVDKPGVCNIHDYWELIHARGEKRLILDPDQFYIL